MSTLTITLTMTPPGRDLSSTMVAGQYFGELALVVESARFASVATPPARSALTLTLC